MFLIFKNKIHLAVACLLVATVIFILHQTFSSYGDGVIPVDIPSKFSSLQGLRQINERDEYIRQDISSYKKQEKFDGEKLVHLDLKGAPPLVSQYDQLFALLKRLGATGLLIEYEDMFPFYDALDNIPALNAYNATDISTILQYAKKYQLNVVPLIQTFGHLEFILKLKEYRDLREVDMYPQVICPTNPKTLPLIYKLIDQMIALHPGITHIHIGSDEVYHIGRCDRCNRIMLERSWGKDELFLSHVRNVTQYIRSAHPSVRPIMWDDEFRGLSEELIAEYGIPKLVDIMIWKYTPEVAEFITDEILGKYSKLFAGIWIATAFKGATGPDSMVTDIRYHLDNHKSWLELVARWKGRLSVQGVALTGWQRYDHFAVLCELLPVAIPSLAVCLRYLDGYDVDEHTLSTMLECEFPFAWSPAFLSSLRPSQNCLYPGSPLYQLVSSVYVTLLDIKQTNRDVARGWFTWHQTIHNFSSPAHVEESSSMVDYHKVQLQFLEDRLRIELSSMYDSHTVEEWISTFILPTSMKLAAASEARGRLLAQKSWPRRPLDRFASDKTLLQNICDGSGSLQCSLLGL